LNLFDRVKNMLLSPAAEWPVIAAEEATTSSLFSGYIVILSAIAPIAALIHAGGAGGSRLLVAYAIALVLAALIAWLADLLAPSFGGERGYVGALKLTAYSATAGWVFGVFDLFGKLGAYLSTIAACYGLYAFYLGAPVLGKCLPQKALGYTLVFLVSILMFITGIYLVLVLMGGWILLRR
jgi:Yip1 domain